MNEEPIKRFTLLVLFQAQQDRARELTIGLSSGSQPPIRYKVGDAWYDMSPPPAHIMPNVIAELGRLAAFVRDSRIPPLRFTAKDASDMASLAFRPAPASPTTRSPRPR